MRIRTDDEVYRVDAVWLGPPKATFPWRARYVAWGVGIVVFLLVLTIERRMNIGFSFFSTAWAVIITITVTRIICAKITHERPLGAVLVMWLRELTAPRETTTPRGGAAGAAKIKVRRERPRPRKGDSGGSAAARAATKKTRRPGKTRRTNRTAGRNPTGARARSSKEVRGVRSPAKP
ncbi:hypothetical protein GIY23_07340 [Allosaccharopolyspora coralli]|uniref:Uncharacterized protein n=1 Tax=Allosaccharopolyspora coralli TaxID=2665642 RepID=A0A5Q3Q7E8_9PSEU|nr:hypothetical protein [Allosaccharopolyspora coralli]QGK69366.1 hypothetical protein GIY23_07340 [Allosaccharopolyspora coralli]